LKRPQSKGAGRLIEILKGEFPANLAAGVQDTGLEISHLIVTVGLLLLRVAPPILVKCCSNGNRSKLDVPAENCRLFAARW